VQADVTRLVEAGGGAPLEALAEQGEAAAASVAARLESHRRELQEADRTQKCAVSSSVPSSMLAALSRVQDCFVLSDPNLPDCPIVYASPAFLKLTGYPCRWVGREVCICWGGWGEGGDRGAAPVNPGLQGVAFATCPGQRQAA
jgi:hypothetical protein